MIITLHNIISLVTCITFYIIEYNIEIRIKPKITQERNEMRSLTN
jgi:hypothetical protein